MANEIKKPNTVSDASAYFQNEANAVDTLTAGDETTYSDCPGMWCDADFLTGDGAIAFYNWSPAVETYTQLDVKVKWRLESASGGDEFGIDLSVDGGTNWDYVILAKGTNDQTTIQTASVNIPTGTTLGLLRVRVTADKVGGSDNNSLRIYDVWSDGVYAGATRRIFNVN